MSQPGPVRSNLRPDYYLEHGPELTRLWLDLFKEKPGAYLTSFLSGNYGYWAPEAHHVTVRFEVHENGVGTTQAPKAPWLREILALHEVAIVRSIQVVSMLHSIGFSTWVIVVAGIVMVVTNRKRRLLVRRAAVLLMVG